LISSNKDELIIIDAHAYLYRSFFAIKALSTKDGFPTNAIYGFIKLINRILKEKAPRHIVAAFDSKAKTFRQDRYALYKAQRPKMPEELSCQIPVAKKILEAMGINSIAIDGYEADDIIYSACKSWTGRSIIVSSDKDLAQCVSETVLIWNIAENKIYDIENVKKKFHVSPSQIPQFLALTGDASDNIPGVPGIGPKRAGALLSRFGSLEEIYKHIDELPAKIKSSLIKYKEQLFEALFLTKIEDNIKLDPKIFVKREENRALLSELYRKLEFKTFAGSAVQKTESEPEAISDDEIKLKLNETEEAAIKVDKNALNLCFDGKLYTANSLPQTADLSNVKIITNDAKTLSHRIGYTCNCFDLSIASYLLNSAKKGSLSWLSFELTGNPAPSVSDYFKLKKLSLQQLKQKGLDFLNNIEQELAELLFLMERRGIKIDKKLLYKKRRELKNRIDSISNSIFMLAGYEFNLNSPKQIAELLFEKIGLKPIRRGKEGPSTDIQTLEKLSNSHPVVALIIKYRALEKLINTYIEPFIRYIEENNDCRIHTTFNQTLTATGRLSSVNPNLQNIPTDNQEYSIRDLFVASEGYTLISSDYSQMELRIMALLSGDKELLRAFENDEDIHSYTASKLFDIPASEVSKAQRRLAKIINFGIMYGMGVNSLAKNLSIDTKTAKIYHEKYFEKYQGVKQFMEKAKLFAKNYGYVTTKFGRKRMIPEINSRNPGLRSFGERAAINAPIQGTSADIIKIAMVKLYNNLKEKGLDAHILLQIHDELLIEAKSSELEKAMKITKESMENAVELGIKMPVDIKIGKNWSELKQIKEP